MQYVLLSQFRLLTHVYGTYTTGCQKHNLTSLKPSHYVLPTVFLLYV